MSWGLPKWTFDLEHGSQPSSYGSGCATPPRCGALLRSSGVPPPFLTPPKRLRRFRQPAWFTDADKTPGGRVSVGRVSVECTLEQKGGIIGGMKYAALVVAFAALPLACHSAVTSGPSRWMGSVVALAMTGATLALLMVR